MGSKTYAPIARTEIARLKRDLNRYIERCETLPAGAELQADAFQYAYVRLCGLLEQSLLWAGRALVSRLSNAEGRAHNLSYLERSSRNPTDEAIAEYVKRFSVTWAAELAEWFEEEERRATINSLVGIRNGIAHGTSFGGSSTWFSRYQTVVYDLTEWLLARFDPKP